MEFSKFFPFLNWLPIAKKSWKDDLIAGITGTIIVIPQAVAFAMIAGLPPIYGFYTAMITPVIAALFGSSLHLISGPTTAISIVVYSTISPFVNPEDDIATFVSLVMVLTFLTGLFQLAMGILRMGKLVNFVSHSVIIGFTAGAGILIAFKQLKHVFAIDVPQGSSVAQIIQYIGSHISETNWLVFSVAMGTLGIAIIIRTFIKALSKYYITGLLLVMDLDQPTRFLNVLLRPQWKSWLTKGGYAITVFGALLTAIGAATFFEWTALISPLMYITAAFSVLVAIYTAFLFAQAKGHDFWQSPTLIIHMFIHSLMAGAAAFGILTLISEGGANWMPFLKMVLTGGILVNLATILMEITITHPTEDAKRTVHMITGGRYKLLFWGGVMIFGNILPLILMNVLPTSAMILAVIGVIVIIGIYWTNKIWIEAPQRLPNS